MRLIYTYLLVPGMIKVSTNYFTDLCNAEDEKWYIPELLTQLRARVTQFYACSSRVLQRLRGLENELFKLITNLSKECEQA